MNTEKSCNNQLIFNIVCLCDNQFHVEKIVPHVAYVYIFYWLLSKGKPNYFIYIMECSNR